MSGAAGALDVADWRARVFALYADVRVLAASDPAAAHERWNDARTELIRTHPASPVLTDAATHPGPRIAPYDPAWRFAARVQPSEPARMDVPTAADGIVPFERVGFVELDGIGTLDVWWLGSYGGGLFVPVKDALAGTPGGTYGGGRYLLDTVKGADLGRTGGELILDFNFAYQPSCAYDPAWTCPLAQAGNTLDVPVPVGERSAQ